ncbi:MAG: hypothetical protein J6K52_01830 [Clostridia bacterium]|nr:hypothetical protein [Clostridia bacterium]
MFNEFSPEEQLEWFDLNNKSVEHHVDSFYYSVNIKDDKCDNEDPGIVCLVRALEELKKRKRDNLSEVIEFCGLEVHPTGFSIYQYHLQLRECFDVFICDNIMNEDTPRICVQLRTRMLIYDGEFKAIEKSYEYVKLIADTFGLQVYSTLENRIDYAFHTNLIQRSTDYLSTEYLREHLTSKLKLFHIIGVISDDVDINTLQLGNRKSNSIFLRIYNKSREVIEQNYKSFFIERWYEKKLISKYDRYVYRRAFELKSYVTGVLIGRCEWYIQYGKSEETKDMLKELIRQCYKNSDNAPQIEKKIKGLLPPVTVINNVEFQTKRKFYASCEKSIDENIFKFRGEPELRRLYKILYLKKEFLNYLTEKTVCFVDNKGTRKESMTDWWKRIHSCKIKYTDPAILKMYREFERNSDLKRCKKRILAGIAQYCAIKNDNLDERSYQEDICDMLSELNDNDVHEVDVALKEGKLPYMHNFQYSVIQSRASRQLKGIINQKEKNGKE